MRKAVALFIFIYNLIGLVAIFSISPDDPFHWEWSPVLRLLTFPITIISFAYRYGTSDPIYPVFIIQFIMLVIILFMGDSIVRRYKK